MSDPAERPESPIESACAYTALGCMAGVGLIVGAVYAFFYVLGAQG